jgi:heterotetrameric sarcosine oxidase gamma subunit
MYHEQMAQGASMVERDGWQQPTRYSSEEEELHSLRDGAGLYDISPSGKVSFRGDNIESFLANVFIDAGRMAVGEVRQVATPTEAETATIVLARLARDEFLALTHAGLNPALAETLAEGPDRCAHVLDMSSGLAGVRITGPTANLLLRQISELDLSAVAFPDMRCAQTKAADIHGTLVRMDRGSLPSYALYFPREFGEYMWDALLEAGAVPVGIEAMAKLNP